MRQVPSSLFGKHILLGITGSVAAIKSITVVNELLQQGAKVKVILTPNALEFIKVADFNHLFPEDIFTYIFYEDINKMDHITLAKWADILLIAPASASIISRCAMGLADQLLSLVYTATAADTFIVPAMNQKMWANYAVQRNVQILKEAKSHFLGPAFGKQACGDIGFGRMLEPQQIVQALQAYYQACAKDLKVLITAGSTQEAIDPVRYLSNYSSGKMGYALANAFTQFGAEVTLISGPTNLCDPKVENFIKIISAKEMQAAVLQYVQEQHIAISAAAIADYRPRSVCLEKIKKNTDILQLELIKNPDILQSIRAIAPNIYLVGFALETQNLIDNARKKLTIKNLDMIVANEFSANNKVFNADENTIKVLERNKKSITFPRQQKEILAKDLARLICSRVKPGL